MTRRDPNASTQLEERVAAWLHATSIEAPSSSLRDRLAAIPLTDQGRQPALAGRLLAIGLTVAAVVVVAVGAFLLLGRDRIGSQLPGGTCAGDADALLRDAVEDLRGAEGYRWTEENEMWGFDPAFPISADDPHYAWSGYRGEGAYLSPDRLLVVATDDDDPERTLGPGGYDRFLSVGGQWWGFIAGGLADPTPSGTIVEWQELPVGSSARDFVPNYLLTSTLARDLPLAPGSLSGELPGSGGCTIVRTLSFITPSGSEPGPPYVIGVRLDADGRLMAGAFESVTDETPEDRRGNVRHRFEIRYEVPDASEFTPPAGPILTPEPVPTP